MKRRLYILFFLIFALVHSYLTAKNRFFLDTDSTRWQLDSLVVQHPDTIFTYNFLDKDGNWLNDNDIQHRLDSLVKIPVSYSDSLLYSANILFAPLAYFPKDVPKLNKYRFEDFYELSNKKQIVLPKPKEKICTEDFVLSMRSEVRDYFTNHHADVYYITAYDLPQTDVFKEHYIQGKPVELVQITRKINEPERKKINVADIEKRYWRKKANALFQFSQNYISSNWYQGGNSNLALLSVLNGQLIYDNLNNIQWENNVEWRAGFNSVEGDTLRTIATNDDLLRYTTKFGLKAFGNWYYSISGEISTQLFDNYKAINSNVFKARLFTPVRANIGLGMDYKYKKILSLMISPITYKYIYVADTINVNPNLFGIVKGQNHLSEMGSSFKAQVTYTPLPNWQIDSRLTFFTNYKKVETDLEIVNNFTFNRFLSARLMLNPRYDNTVIEKNGVKARIQFKQLLSVGLSLRLL